MSTQAKLQMLIFLLRGYQLETDFRYRNLIAHASLASGVSDAVVIDEFKIYLPSYNAESAFCGLLGMACEIALHRPHLMESLFPTVVAPAFSMGVDGPEGFIAYADVLIEHDASKEAKYQQFSPQGVDYFRHTIHAYSVAIQRIVDELKTGLG